MSDLKPGTIQARPGGVPGKRSAGGRRHGCIATYSAGCRCDECREARRVYALADLGERTQRRARERAASYVVHNHPRVWKRIVAEVRAELEADDR